MRGKTERGARAFAKRDKDYRGSLTTRTLDANAFAAFCAFLDYPLDDVVDGVIADYGFDRHHALELVSAAYRDRDEIDIRNAHDELTMCSCEAKPGAPCSWHGPAPSRR